MKKRVLVSTANALTKPCKKHKAAINVACNSDGSIVCPERRAKFKITEPGKRVMRTFKTQNEKE